ncbi:MSF1-domain-containing protein [Cylindrobasidium torrendii FP15055 ss-10]|uniref:MSF1-domain-containing protein n=1 Tax=Cylindrobasidium torrendii FP15055 ss-10 TaxID=1314674 RepID=A0A0D7B6Q0_9AGAR|nr:MSF1-domain-containing protein [Cylindrobasidium torrendii FP15055 ss-10]
MKFYTHTFAYDDSWSIVSLAYFLRYPNPYASHIVSVDVINRELSPAGTLLTTRLILKRGHLPRWAPRGIISRAESWVVEESEVDPLGRTLSCTTKNLEFTKVMKVEESVHIRANEEGKTLQTNEARVRSRFGWGLTKRIEAFGLHRFETHLQRSKDGVALMLATLRQHRQTLGGAPVPSYTPNVYNPQAGGAPQSQITQGSWQRLKGWFGRSA